MAGALTGCRSARSIRSIRSIRSARRRREADELLVREGLDVWRCRQQQLLAKKADEQRELREMLVSYSPWGRPGGGAPNSDTIRKRKALQVETLYGGPSSAAPAAPAAPDNTFASYTLPRLPAQHHRHAQQQSRRLRCDPLLLFQFQEADRRAVDNMLRYRTDPRQQEQYRLELDRMVQEKRSRQQQQQQKQQQQHQRQQQLQQQHLQLQQEQQQLQQRHQHRDEQQETYQRNQQENSVRRRRSAGSPSEPPQRDRAPQGGVELVPLLDRRRQPPVSDDPTSPAPRRQRAHLPTTDVTNVTKVKEEEVSQEKEQTWRDLAAQVDRKQRQREASRAEELERCRQHFETWQMLWGRPGHGAPRDVKVKEKLDVILYHLDHAAQPAVTAR